MNFYLNEPQLKAIKISFGEKNGKRQKAVCGHVYTNWPKGKNVVRLVESVKASLSMVFLFLFVKCQPFIVGIRVLTLATTSVWPLVLITANLCMCVSGAVSFRSIGP